MPTMLEPTLRFSDVAFGIEAPPKTLRNWLQREQVDLFSDAPLSGGWRRFPLIDVAILALVRRLVTFGINVETASALAHTILIKMQGDTWLELSPNQFIMFWINRGVLLTPNGADSEPGDASSWDLEIRYMNEGCAPPAGAFLTLAPGRIVRAALARALTGDETATDDESELLPEPVTLHPVPKALLRGAGHRPASDDADPPSDGT